MHAVGEFILQQIVDHAVTRHQALAAKAFRHHFDFKMGLAHFARLGRVFDGMCMSGMTVRIRQPRRAKPAPDRPVTFA